MPTVEEEFGNYAIDSTDLNRIVLKNDVFVEGTTRLSVDKIRKCR